MKFPMELQSSRVTTRDRPASAAGAPRTSVPSSLPFDEKLLIDERRERVADGDQAYVELAAKRRFGRQHHAWLIATRR